VAARGIQQAREHLERGGFARAVRAEEADEFAGFNLEADIADGGDGLVFAFEQATERAFEAGLLLVGAKGFGQAVNFDGRHWGSLRSKV
jgi:hypothetical protein